MSLNKIFQLPWWEEVAYTSEMSVRYFKMFLHRGAIIIIIIVMLKESKWEGNKTGVTDIFNCLPRFTKELKLWPSASVLFCLMSSTLNFYKLCWIHFRFVLSGPLGITWRVCSWEVCLGMCGEISMLAFFARRPLLWVHGNTDQLHSWQNVWSLNQGLWYSPIVLIIWSQIIKEEPLEIIKIYEGKQIILK